MNNCAECYNGCHILCYFQIRYFSLFCFDIVLARESTLDVLERVAPSDLFEQLFLAAVCTILLLLILVPSD